MSHDKPKLWHCFNTRSLRALWTLEELGIEYDLENLKFPPRVFHKDYLQLNPLGTVPYFVHGDTAMTESTAICQYLIDRYQRFDIGLEPSHPEYGANLNWLHQSDATFTFPQTLILRYSKFEPKERRSPQVAEDYSKWFLSRLKNLNTHLNNHDYLCDNRFTIADIAVGYALFLGTQLGLSKQYEPQVNAYLSRLTSRPAFKRASQFGAELAFDL
jgi:glutathione S-transferase